jgi:hypothetical protein
VSDDGHLLAACGRGVHRGGHRGVLDQYPADAPAQHLRIDEEVVELTDAASALSHDREPEQLPAVADRDADPSLAIASGATPQSVGMSLEDSRRRARGLRRPRPAGYPLTAACSGGPA